MGKYLIKVESMDMTDKMDERYENGIECDGFVLIADNGEGYTTAIHKMSVDDISDCIKGDSKMMSAAILANAKREIIDITVKEERGNAVLKALLGMD